MKKIFQKINRRCLNLAIVAVLVLPEIASAQYFTAGKGDLLAGFRVPNVGSYELVVNVGNISNFLAQPIGTVIPISSFSGALSDSFSSHNNLQWSVSAAFLTAGPGGSWDGFPGNTVWYTLPRANPSIQTSTPSRQSDDIQSNLKQSILSIAIGATDIGTALGTTNQDNNTVLVREPAGNTEDYSVQVKDPQNIYLGDFGGYLPSTAENTTPSNFVSAVVSDLYLAVPNGKVDPINSTTSGPADYVGYFTFNPDGSMTFTRAVPAPPQPPVPQITSITRASGTTTVYFTTTNGPTYVLYYTNSTGLATSVTNWPSSPTTLTGDGGTDHLSDTTTVSNRFYKVGAHN